VSRALAPRKTQPPVIFSERDWNGEGLATLRSCTLPTTRPTLYAEWTDIELVRDLSPGRAEVPVSYWQRRCRRQALHFNRPTVFLAGAFLHSQSHGRASQHDRIIFAVTGRNVMKTHYSVTLAMLAGFGLGAVAVEGRQYTKLLKSSPLTWRPT